MNRKGVSYDVGPFMGGDSVANHFAACRSRSLGCASWICLSRTRTPRMEPRIRAYPRPPRRPLWSPSASPPVPVAGPSASAVIRPASGDNPPLQSREDTDAGWGERPEPDDDERLYRDRPPHWEK